MDWMRVLEFAVSMVILFALVIWLASKIRRPVCHTCGTVMDEVPPKARVAWCAYCERVRDVIWERPT